MATTTHLIRPGDTSAKLGPKMQIHCAPGEGLSNSVCAAPADELPVLLAGPILRRADTGAIFVWMATCYPINVEGSVLQPPTGTSGAGTSSALPPAAQWTVLGTGRSTSISLGARLHFTLLRIAANTAYPNDVILGYDLTFFPPSDDFEFSDEGGLLDQNDIAYPGWPLPTFTLGSATGPCNLLHGSCHKLHGPGDDATLGIDSYLGSVVADPATRPSALLFTGDQIYGDDVDSTIIDGIIKAGKILLGWEEKTPDRQSPIDGNGDRSPAVIAGGFTVEADVAHCHLMGFGEFATMYLLSWSLALWDHPPIKRMVGGLSPLRPAIAAARRALANVPCYMIMDDHEITDDWPMTADMVANVQKSDLTSWIVANGMAACWAFQLWGNMDGIGGTDSPPFLSALRTYLAEGAKLPPTPDDAAWQPFADARKAYVSAVLGTRGYSFITPTVPPVVFMDTRTQRELFTGNNKAPGLLNGAGFGLLQNQIKRISFQENMPLLIVAPCPVIGYAAAEEFIKPTDGTPLDFSKDPEQWAYNTDAFLQLLRTMGGTGRDIVFFSGDVHYGFTGWGHFVENGKRTDIAQLTSSSLLNQPAGFTATALGAAQLLQYPSGIPAEVGHFWEVPQGGSKKVVFEKTTLLTTWSKPSVASQPGAKSIAELSYIFLYAQGTDVPFQTNNFGVVRVTWSGTREVRQQLRGSSLASSTVTVPFGIP